MFVAIALALNEARRWEFYAFQKRMRTGNCEFAYAATRIAQAFPITISKPEHDNRLLLNNLL
jgi:hypothetical protein